MLATAWHCLFYSNDVQTAHSAAMCNNGRVRKLRVRSIGRDDFVTWSIMPFINKSCTNHFPFRNKIQFGLTDRTLIGRKSASSWIETNMNCCAIFLRQLSSRLVLENVYGCQKCHIINIATTMPSALVAPCTYCVDRHYSRQRRRLGGRGRRYRISKAMLVFTLRRRRIVDIDGRHRSSFAD